MPNDFKREVRNLLKEAFIVLSNRLIIMALIFGVFTYTLLVRLFEMQIVNGEAYQDDLRQTDTEDLPVLASRGEIFDRYGRPLAVNTTTYTVKLNPSAEFDKEKLNDNLLSLLELFEENGEQYIDELPLTQDEPYTLIFGGSITREKRWRLDMNIKDTSRTGDQVFAELREKFGIDSDLSNARVRQLVSLRSAIYMKRYQKFSPITLAVNVSDTTMAIIEEETEKYAGIYVEPDYLRQYPGGITFSHMIGYVGKINDTDYDTYEQYGYRDGDPVGKTGLEQALELELRGKDGKRTVEVDAGTGLVLKVLDSGTEPVPGTRFFLTVDSYLQDRAYEILENKLKEILINRLSGVSPKDLPLTATDVLTSIVRGNTISLRKIWQSDETMYGYRIKEYVLYANPEADPFDTDGDAKVREIIAAGAENGDISLAHIILLMVEQGIITADENLLARIKNGAISPLSLILQKLEEGEITPQMTNLDPSTGSIVVLDVHTGGVITAVSYPTYDNSQMVHNFNEYFPIINGDPTSPTYYRAFRERRAPGSTFKMITAITGLEEGSITPHTLIHDDLVFTKAGEPYLRCWSSVSHGNIDVIQALTVSCNTFFCETAYRLGNTKDGNPEESINALNKYMIAFGLNERTGVEIGEAYDTRSSTASTQMQISSPEYKMYLDRLYDRNVISRWLDGDTIATAIGQSKNNYTAASMAKYIATLANGGTRYKLHFTNYREDFFGGEVIKDEPVVEGSVNISPSTLNAVFTGMYNTVNAQNGTGSSVFANFDYEIGGKTGTAQENEKRNDHTSFAGFAPFDDPQIAIYVLIPFGDTSGTPAAAAYVAKDVIEAYFSQSSQREAPVRVNELSM